MRGCGGGGGCEAASNGMPFGGAWHGLTAEPIAAHLACPSASDAQDQPCPGICLSSRHDCQNVSNFIPLNDMIERSVDRQDTIRHTSRRQGHAISGMPVSRR